MRAGIFCFNPIVLFSILEIEPKTGNMIDKNCPQPSVYFETESRSLTQADFEHKTLLLQPPELLNALIVT